MQVRRVVTGHSPDGKAVVASDEVVAPITLDLLPGAEFHRLWGADTAPTFPDEGVQAPHHEYFPPVGGFRFGTFSVAPQSTSLRDDLDLGAAFAEMDRHLPGLAGYMEPDAPGMHTTPTIDFEYVVSGRVVLELDDGVTVELGPGDTVVQNGTRHAWRNPYDEPCTMVVFIVGAHHRTC
jgi:mannose-6-phosphate isomerase-like protein (cupin superfamily)